MAPRHDPLPIDDALPALRAALARRSRAVLVAPPGAGKTTRVPLDLLDAPWLAGGRLVMLEPRRVAARAAAARMAATLGEQVGETVGVRTRGDSRVSARTRLEVVTEGVLTRMLLADPALEGVHGLLFDEFHERHLVGDTGLALALETQDVLRPDLRLLVMSATIDSDAIARLLGDAPVIASAGRQFDVRVTWRPPRADDRVEAHVARSVRAALADGEGDVLVFLPGAGEIRRVEQLLTDGALPPDVRVRPLHGLLPSAVQDAAIAPAVPGERKVILATSIAETSLTIDGVRVVVDAGWSRLPRFSPRTGMTRLETVRVSKASAEQRRGRAGRTGPGSCWRLWAEHDHHALLDRTAPEMLDADLAPLALDLAAAGVRDARTLRWLDPPPPAAFATARELLRELGALDDAGAITPHGTRLSALPLHPRLAHMVLVARERDLGTLACDVAALLADRDVLRGMTGPPDADLRLRVEALRDGRRGGAALAALGLAVDAGALARVRADAGALRRAAGIRAAGIRDDGGDAEDTGLLVALAYPDRVAMRRSPEAPRFVLRGGQGAALAGAQSLAASEWLAVAHLDVGRHETRIFLAAPIDRATVEREFGDAIVREDDAEWDAASGTVRGRRRERLGAIVLREQPLDVADPTVRARAMARWVAGHGVGALPWREGARQTQQRILFVRALGDGARGGGGEAWPDVSDAALAATVDDWLAPYLAGHPQRDALARMDLAALLLARLSWQQRNALDALAPTHLEVPTGSRLPVDYTDPVSPVLAVRVQELFGLADTPRVGGGQVPVTLHLLSPAHRPVQVTRDLAGFWRSSYAEVRKEMRGRYPRHPWPDDPLAAEPTRRAKRKGERG